MIRIWMQGMWFEHFKTKSMRKFVQRKIFSVVSIDNSLFKFVQSQHNRFHFGMKMSYMCFCQFFEIICRGIDYNMLKRVDQKVGKTQSQFYIGSSYFYLMLRSEHGLLFHNKFILIEKS